MLTPQIERDASVALYWDFENLHASLCEERDPGAYARPDNRFRPQEPLVDIQAVVEFAASFGPIAINRAYCNWQFFGRYRDALLQNGVELLQLFPPGGAAKNGADIKLCLDANEDIGRFAHIGTVVIVGGDSDFMPLSQKIKAAGRTLVGVGTRRATNRHWAKSCHEFRYYENLVEPMDMPTPDASVAEVAAAAQPAMADPHTELLRRAIRLLAEKKGDVWVNKAEIWPMIKRLDSTFDPKEAGFTNFAAMIKAKEDMVELRRGEFDQEVKLR
ncbi:MAG: NYN domain-containing protein [Betaproteobacteria bacterium]|nr:NYN domain-containing protein [Betaproteobacteria bacterium]